MEEYPPCVKLCTKRPLRGEKGDDEAVIYNKTVPKKPTEVPQPRMPGTTAGCPSTPEMVSQWGALQLRPGGRDTVRHGKQEEHCEQREQHMQRL